MSNWKIGLDEKSILIIEKLVWAYENCNIADNKVIRDFINSGIDHIKTQSKETAALREKLAAAEKERDAVIEDFESAAHTGDDFCEFCGADCVDAGNDYIEDIRNAIAENTNGWKRRYPRQRRERTQGDKLRAVFFYAGKGGKINSNTIRDVCGFLPE